MIDQIFINVGHLYKFLPQNINTHVYEHWQAVDMASQFHLTSYKITHIEANSMNIGMRNDVPTCFSIKKEHNINFQHSL